MLLASQVGLKVANSGGFLVLLGALSPLDRRPPQCIICNVSQPCHLLLKGHSRNSGGWAAGAEMADAWPVQVRALAYRKRAPLSGEARQSPTNRLLRPGIDGSLGKGLVIELSLGRAALGPGRGHRLPRGQRRGFAVRGDPDTGSPAAPTTWIWGDTQGDRLVHRLGPLRGVGDRFRHHPLGGGALRGRRLRSRRRRSGLR